MNSNPKDKNTKLAAVLLSWFSAKARDLPWRRTCDPYAIWVSEIMLQQTQVKTVIPYWERWMRELPTIQAAAKASSAKLHKLWEGLGYYTRVRNLQKAAQQIVAQHNGKFPEKFDDILALPGIGRYTAGAIASIAFNQPRPILDGNVIRVLTRVFGICRNPRERKTNAQLWRLAEDLVGLVSHCPPRRRAKTAPHLNNSCSHLNQSLMELGALICTPRSPLCYACPVNKFCIARKQHWQQKLPNLGQRTSTTARRFIALVVERDGKFLVRQRPSGVVNAHLWEFPNDEVGATKGRARHSVRAGYRPISTQPLCTIKHSITRYRITLQAYRARLVNSRIRPKDKWFTLLQLRELAFAGAHKKILVQLEHGR